MYCLRVPTTGSLKGSDGYCYTVLGVAGGDRDLRSGDNDQGFLCHQGIQLIGSTSILSRGEKLVLEDNRARIETPVTKAHQTGTGLPFFRVNRIEKGVGTPECWIGRRQVHVLMMMGSSDEWTDSSTGHLWVDDSKTTTLVEEGDSRVSWYRGVPYRKVEPGERYGNQRNTERAQARDRGEKSRRLCDADEEWFQHTVEVFVDDEPVDDAVSGRE